MLIIPTQFASKMLDHEFMFLNFRDALEKFGGSLIIDPETTRDLSLKKQFTTAELLKQYDSDKYGLFFIIAESDEYDCIHLNEINKILYIKKFKNDPPPMYQLA